MWVPLTEILKRENRVWVHSDSDVEDRKQGVGATDGSLGCVSSYCFTSHGQCSVMSVFAGCKSNVSL